MKSSHFIAIFGFHLFASALAANSKDLPQSAPNVVVILTDDQGWGDLSIHGNKNLKTPNLDSLAREGAMMEHFYVSPVCSPTRAEFLTGRYHLRGGVTSTSSGGERLNLGAITIAEVFQQAGYATGAFGKWHNGTQPPYHPRCRGFDTFYGFTSGHWGHYYSPMMEADDHLVKGEGYMSDDFTNHAMRFVEAHREEPFFCYLAFNTPHSPMQVPETYWSRFEDQPLEMRYREPDREDLDHTRAALAMCENLDWNVGRLLKKLDALALRESTIVVFFCDNGPNGNRWNSDFRGRKGSTDEGGVRSPLFIRWPNHIRASTRLPQISAAIDLLPTLGDLAGIAPIKPSSVDGVSLSDLLLGRSSSIAERVIFSHWNGRVSARSQNFRLDHQGRLYDMRADQAQREEVSTRFPGIRQQLKDAVERWKTEQQVGIQRPKRPFTVGDSDHHQTLLPVRDAQTTGKISRSNRFPNDAYLTGWTQASDLIQWPVEVRHEGLYEVRLWYTCAPENLNSLLELSFGGEKIRARVDEAWNPALQGAEQDRVPRQESLIKPFKPFPMGYLYLHKTSGDLRLKALDIPGSSAPDIRLLELKYVQNP